MLAIETIRIDYKKLRKSNRYRVIDHKTPTVTWSVTSNHRDDEQTEYRVRIEGKNGFLWDSQTRQGREQSLRCEATLPTEERLTVTVTVNNRFGEEASAAEYFFVSGLDAYAPQWITLQGAKENSVMSFRREFSVTKSIATATLYVSGIGYHDITVNGRTPDEAVMEPLLSNYSKTVYFTVIPEAERFLLAGENCIGVEVGDGWRHARWDRYGTIRTVGDGTYFGDPQLAAVLHLIYEDGTEETLMTDESWQCAPSAVTYATIFNGEMTDRRCYLPHWNLVGGGDGFTAATVVPSPGGVNRPATLEPITPHEVYTPLSVMPLGEDTYLVDFGQNIAGVTELILPEHMEAGQVIKVKTSELIGHDGDLSGVTMRCAASEDTYIAAGDERDLRVWKARFTYHGFRYARVSGYPLFDASKIKAISYYTDIASDSYFRCGSAVANAIQKMIVQTEKANIHGILTDCPQRDERMGWMNDATVRFEETPYNFDIATVFPKLVHDLTDEQIDGAITCTAPFASGKRPADPVSSSFLIAGWQAYLYSGNREVLEKNFDAFAAWEECLLRHSDDYIVSYSYYGDWAAPVYATVDGDHDIDGVQNLYTPGIYMSTAYSFFNARLLSYMAAALGKSEEEATYAALADKIREAMLAKWWDGESGKMATGSQGCQALALWLGILPEDKRALAAKVLHDDLVARDLKFTTGNLVTRYLFDVLTEYGYLDTAWKLFTKESYPSFGYMLQHGATTVWERFELKQSLRMNSHCHPMYGAVGYWLYAYIAGIKVTSAACDTVSICPYIPTELMSAEAQVETVKGRVGVRWMKQWDQLSLFVTVPFGMKAAVEFDGKRETVGCGCHIFTKKIQEDAYFR